MMLQIAHRESHDVDIFLCDPQSLPFLDPQKQDFNAQANTRVTAIAFEAVAIGVRSCWRDRFRRCWSQDR
ncbi:hypothetical protein [Bradyrhizobium genosp. SA-3]|uniref:hypothetical protein n=1 Tax=Bradyrhizobium genosp. SA-3 TaxID=508868 RepID=UPI001029C2F4|nr:hypothetical protein [Bradyrhizobium genosp. SA-3]